MRPIFIFLSVVLSSLAHSQWDSTWQTKYNDALIGVSTNPSNPSQGVNQFISIRYGKDQNCQPTVGLLTMRGDTTLGDLQKQTVTSSIKNGLILSVNGRDYIFRNVTHNQYPRGMESVSLATNDLIRALSQNATVAVSYGRSPPEFTLKTSGFSAANAKAKRNCK